MSGISRGKVKNINIPGGRGCSKKYVLNPPGLVFFWNNPIYIIFGGLYFAASKMSHNFSLNVLEAGLLYLFHIMMNSYFMSVHHLVCHLDLNSMKTHKEGNHVFSALALTVNFMSRF